MSLLPAEVQSAIESYNDRITAERLTLALAHPPADPQALRDLKREIRAFNQRKQAQPVAAGTDQQELF